MERRRSAGVGDGRVAKGRYDPIHLTSISTFWIRGPMSAWAPVVRSISVLPAACCAGLSASRQDSPCPAPCHPGTCRIGLGTGIRSSTMQANQRADRPKGAGSLPQHFQTFSKGPSRLLAQKIVHVEAPPSMPRVSSCQPRSSASVVHLRDLPDWALGKACLSRVQAAILASMHNMFSPGLYRAEHSRRESHTTKSPLAVLGYRPGIHDTDVQRIASEKKSLNEHNYLNFWMHADQAHQ